MQKSIVYKNETTKSEKEVALAIATPFHAAMTNGGRLASTLVWQKLKFISKLNNSNEYRKQYIK